MARDLIGPALPPGFKALGTAEDEERDPSPGKLRRVPAGLALRSEWTAEDWRAGNWGVGACDPNQLSFPSPSGRRRWLWGLRNKSRPGNYLMMCSHLALNGLDAVRNCQYTFSQVIVLGTVEGRDCSCCRGKNVQTYRKVLRDFI